LSSSPLRSSVSTIVLSLLFATAGCGPSDAHVATKFASDFVPQRHVVSVLGVFKDGQMSSDAWTTIAGTVSPSLGASECAAGYTETLQATNGDLLSAIDGYTRDAGPTDGFLAQIAPAAKGDLIVVITFAGQLPAHRPKNTIATNSGPAGVGQAPRVAAGGGMRGAGRKPSDLDSNELDIAATVFSVAQRRSVGQISLRYLGTSIDEAVTLFAAQVADALPQARCEGWDWSAKIDAQHLRQMGDE
jgi:hypothetical protein